MKKEKITNSELYESMIARGITFNSHTKREAIVALENTNYYYKLSSFRKNFEKTSEGIYINCDFAHLIDLATIDMHVRNYLLQMSLSIEHFIKTEISRLITQNKIENGYDIVYEYYQKYPRQYEKTVDKFENTRYQKEMWNKRSKEMPIWVLMEHMDYTALTKLATLYYNKYGKEVSLEKVVELAVSSRYIRNACAHNSTFILEWFSNVYKIRNNPSTIKSVMVNINIPPHQRKYSKVNDLVATFALLKTYASEGTISHFRESGKNLLERWNKYNDYSNIPKVQNMYDILEKLVDYLEK